MPLLEDAEIYGKYAEELVRFATGLVGPSDAADCVSSAVLRCILSKGWGTVRNRRAFLYRAVVNEARQSHRATMRRRAREARASAPEPSVVTGEVRPEILQAVGALSTGQRAAIFLTYWADLNPGSIGRLLGVSEGTVRANLARGRAKLRKELDVYQEG